MIVNYIIVEADEFLKNAAIDKINREHNRINKIQEEEGEGDDNYCSEEFNAPGHILFTSGKMFESEIKDLMHEDDQYDLIIYGITITFNSSGYILIYIHYANIFDSLITESLGDSNIGYDANTCFGDLEIYMDEDNETGVKEWLQNLPSLIERSEEYKQLTNNINKWQKVFGN